MSSPPDPGSAPLVKGDAPACHPPLPLGKDGRVRVAGDKSNDHKKKKKRSNRSKKGSGFEEYFCDPPMTPAEHNEEQTVIYAPHRPFVDRIEECIQRYRARRRLDSRRENMFSKYLTLGGVDATVRQFQGSRNMTEDVLADATKSAVREMTADDVIQRGGDENNDPRFYNPNYPEHWEVDFTGVASGFLSEHLQNYCGASLDDVWTSVEVVSNFLKYVVRHDVCPEYSRDLKNAQAVCEQAIIEIPAIGNLFELVPGDFNAALRALHCKTEDNSGQRFGNYTEMAVPDITQAQKAKASTLAILLGHEHTKAYHTWTVTKTIEHTFEVCKINLPNSAIHAKYKTVNDHFTNDPDIQACGTIIARPVVIKNGWDNTMTETIPPDAARAYKFVLEESILQLLTVGMKLTMGVCIMDSGFTFIRYLKDIKPSFYVFLPQELMLKYKEPVLSGRPGPSIHQDEDGDVLAGIPFGDEEEQDD